MPTKRGQDTARETRPMTIYERCLLLRRSQKMQQKDMPGGQSAYSRFEKGEEVNVGLLKLARIAVNLGVETFEELFEGVNQPLEDFIRDATRDR